MNTQFGGFIGHFEKCSWVFKGHFKSLVGRFRVIFEILVGHLMVMLKILADHHGQKYVKILKSIYLFDFTLMLLRLIHVTTYLKKLKNC